ncbi:hypothetical protein B0H21DRAFT_878593 [Amylocystis lapponica]|nr:hypothetical protein B0H21DRAFT_878593 [Amylocystis lapponica]
MQRFQSTTTGQSPPSMSSHVAAGLAGGAVVLLGGYAWYHFSGAKTLVSASKSAQAYYEQTKRTVAEKAPKNPNEVLAFLRSTAKSYAGPIPGVSAYVDSTFDALDELHETHGEEMNKVLQKGYDEVKQILKENNNSMDVETGIKVMAVLRQRMGELQEVGKKAGQDALGALGKQYPQIAEKLGGGYDELKQMAEKRGPEAKKILDETTQQVKSIFAKGFSQDALSESQELIQSKSTQIKKLAESSAQDAWKKGLKDAGPYLDKFPEIKQLLDDNASKFTAAGAATLSGNSNAAQEIFQRLKEAAESGVAGNKEKKQELKEFVLKKAKETEGQASDQVQKSWDMLQGWIKTIPGGEEALKKAPNLGALIEVSQERGEDAKKLTQEACDDIMKVLEEKGKKAKELARKAGEEAKTRS